MKIVIVRGNNKGTDFGLVKCGEDFSISEPIDADEGRIDFL